MITVACVEWADYYERGRDYVRKLRDAAARNLSKPHRFVCLTDDPTRHPGIECQTIPRRVKDGLVGWWTKLYLFTADRFPGRVLYLDLDSLVTGPLDELVEHKGIIHLAQWGWRTPSYGSGVMVWDAGEHADAWKRYTPQVPFSFRGDQDWLTHLGGWEALPDGVTRSYRYHCKEGVPDGCAVVCMHGPDKPHAIETGWVPEMWR